MNNTAKSTQDQALWILETAPPHSASKIFTRCVDSYEKQDFDAGYLFTPSSHYPDGLHDLYQLLISHQDQNCFIVQGHPVGPVVPRIRRLKHPRPDETNGATFLGDLPKRLFVLDVDKFDGTLQEYLQRLPESFRAAGYVIQYSASYQVFDNLLNCHLFFWLDVPLTCSQKKQIAQTINSDHDDRLIDEAVQQPQQPIYFTRPLFKTDSGESLPDPIGDDRIVLIDGPEFQSEPLIKYHSFRRTKFLPPRDIPRTKISSNTYLERIGVDGCHRQILSYCVLLAREGNDVESIAVVVQKAIEDRCPYLKNAQELRSYLKNADHYARGAVDFVRRTFQ